MNKKVCIITHGPVESDGRIIKTINYLVDTGLKVWVFYPQPKTEKPINKLQKNNITLIPIELKDNISRRFLRHSFFTLEYSYFISEVLKTQIGFDLIYVNDLPMLYSGVCIKRKIPSASLIYDSHEIYTETINQFFPEEVNLLKKTLYRFLIWIMRQSGIYAEEKLVKKVDLFITVNESLKDYFEKKYNIKDIRVIMNCPQEKRIIHNNLNIDFRKKYNWEDSSTVFLYQGILNQGRGLELLLNTFSKTPENFKLIIIGKGVLKNKLTNLIRKYQLEEKVKLIGFIPYQFLEQYTRAADIGINLLEPYNLSKELASPNKLFEYIHAGLPVICSNTIENSKVLHSHDIGILIENSEASLLRGLLFLGKKENLEAKRKNLKKAAEEYVWEKQIKVIKKLV